MFALMAPIKAEATQMKVISFIGLLLGLGIFRWLRNTERREDVRPPIQSIPGSHEYGD
jgi:hypothetical protein